MADRLRSQQQAWARYIRDPSQPLPAGIARERLDLYRRLCIGGVEGVLEGSFPRLRTALGESRWQRLVADFYARHRCETPLFPELGSEFLAWLLDDGAAATLLAWELELAHFEWTSQQLLLEDVAPQEASEFPPTIDTPLRLASLSRICGYRWPVHDALAAMHADSLPPPAPTLLLLQRTRDHTLQIAPLSALDYAVLQALAEEPRSTRACLHALASECGEQPALLIAQGERLLEHLQAKDVVQPAERDNPSPETPLPAR